MRRRSTLTRGWFTNGSTSISLKAQEFDPCASSKLHAVRTHLKSIVFQRAELKLKIGVTMLHRRDFDGTEFLRTTIINSTLGASPSGFRFRWACNFILH